MKAGICALIAGILFGAGLAVSGMADPANVLAFLVLSPGWNPALVGVMGGAVVTTAIGYALITRRGKPLLAAAFSIPDAVRIDSRLGVGAALFGIGWGLAGYCPGPGFVGAGMLDVRAAVFLISFGIGVGVFELAQKQLNSAGMREAGDG